MHRWFTAFVLLVVVAVAASAIVGGEWVDGARHKYVVYVETLSGPCTGVLIEPTWVLTAAHCVVEHDGTIRPGIVYDVEVGYPGTFETNDSIVRVLAHPDYYWQGAGFRHDVALIELAQPFQRYAVVPIVKPASGMEGFGFGWGLMENDRNSDEGLRWFDAPVMLGSDCRLTAQFKFEEEIANDLTICTMGDDEEGRINSGDSGGPLVVRMEDGGWGLVGIASITGETAAGRTVVSVYADAWQALPWIEGVVSGTVQAESVSLPELKAYGPGNDLVSETLEARDSGIIFVNESDHIVSQHWIDYDGGERFYGSLEPGESYSQHTFPGHVWAVKDPEGQTLAIYVAEMEMARAVITGEVAVAVAPVKPVAPVEAVASVASAAAEAAVAEGLPENLSWQPATGGIVPATAVPAGAESGGTPLYICRATIEGGLHPGKIREPFAGCAVPWGGKEKYISPYEVLVATGWPTVETAPAVPVDLARLQAEAEAAAVEQGNALYAIADALELIARAIWEASQQQP